MFVCLGGRLYKIEFVRRRVGAILVRCIKCEGFLLSFFSSRYLYDNLVGMLNRRDSH